MKLTRDEFLRLQQTWYQKLSDLGFNDIEKLQGDELVLSQTASYCYRNGDPFTRAMKEQYFRFMSQAVYDENTEFKNEVHRHIMIRHSEGAKIKTILKELHARGTARNRNSIRFIIRKYEVAWGLRSYNPSQLNVKKKA